MLIKRGDSIEPRVGVLRSLLAGNLSSDERSSVEAKLRMLSAGEKGENSSRYYIDFYFEGSRNWVVLHDLRLEHGGKVAQIDHLLINRMFVFYVLETKNFSQGIKVNKRGEFMVLCKDGQYRGIASPIEQNERHIMLMKRLFKEIGHIFPKRVGMHIKPSYKHYVLMSPQAKIVCPEGVSGVIKSDAFYKETQKESGLFDLRSLIDDLRSLIDLSKMVSTETLKSFAERLAEYHRPAFACKRCGKIVSARVIAYCRDKFQGQIYCYACQRR